MLWSSPGEPCTPNWVEQRGREKTGARAWGTLPNIIIHNNRTHIIWREIKIFVNSWQELKKKYKKINNIHIRRSITNQPHSHASCAGPADPCQWLKSSVLLDLVRTPSQDPRPCLPPCYLRRQNYFRPLMLPYYITVLGSYNCLQNFNYNAGLIGNQDWLHCTTADLIDQAITQCSHCPVADELPCTEGKVLECKIVQLLLPCLKAIIGKENDGSVIPEKRRHRGVL